jgi:heat shock protein HtpX
MQGAGYQNYDTAFAEVKGKKSHIIPRSGLAAADDPGVRQAFGDADVKKSFKRESGDIMMAVNRYRFIECSCGLRIKVPPEYGQQSISCPKCGTDHNM